jgi:hypothetical protein
MAKALMGHMANDHLLQAQIVSLRARVATLETQLAQARAALAVDADLAGAVSGETGPGGCDQTIVLPLDLELSELVDHHRATRALA